MCNTSEGGGGGGGGVGEAGSGVSGEVAVQLLLCVSKEHRPQKGGGGRRGAGASANGAFISTLEDK